jgi:hypothetical protein
MVSTTVTGRVVDESGAAVNLATVTVEGQDTQTDLHGVFALPAMMVPDQRVHVLVTRDGYFSGSKVLTPVPNGVTNAVVTLVEAVIAGNVEANVGGTVNAGEGHIQLGGGLTRQGLPVTGQVQVAARLFLPGDALFTRVFADTTAQRANGTEAQLVSYGFMRVQLTDEEGLEVQPGATPATLTFPAPTTGTPPQSIPLWFWDTTSGMWREEGSAQRQGNQYVGTVTHFTDWNLDHDEDRAKIHGRVMCGDRPEPTGVVVVGFSEINVGEDGFFQRFVPTNTPLSVYAFIPENGSTSQTVSVPPLASGDDYNVSDLVIEVCPAIIVGSVTCYDIPVAATVFAEWNGGGASAQGTGGFRIKVKEREAVELYITSDMTTLGRLINVRGPSVGPLLPGQERNVGEVDICVSAWEPGDLAPLVPLRSGNKVHMGRSGQHAAFSGDGDNAVVVYDVTAGQEVSQIMVSNGVDDLDFSGNLTRGLVVPYGQDPVFTADLLTGQTLGTFPTLMLGGALSPDGSFVVGWDFSMEDLPDWSYLPLSRFDAATGMRTHTYAFRSPQLLFVQGMRLDGQQLVMAGPRDELSLTTPWRLVVLDLQTDTLVADHIIQTPFITQSLGLHGGQYFVLRDDPAGDAADTLRFFDVLTGQEVKRLVSGVFSLLPGGARYVLETRSRGTPQLALYDWQTDAMITRLPFVDLTLEAVAGNEAGTTVVGTFTDGTGAVLHRTWRAPP